MSQTKLNLDQSKIDRARALSKEITQPVNAYIKQHTTVAIERATLRMLGADGVTPDDVPVPNAIVNALGSDIQYGASKYYINALIRKNLSVEQLNAEIAKGLDIAKLELTDMSLIQEKAKELVAGFSHRVKGNVAYRTSKISEHKEKENAPLLYLIVATGNIYEDVQQAQAAARQGADVIAVIRTTGQSLLDFVPYGATTEGFGGTYATQENFKIMRKALDETGNEIGKYIRLVNYCSGLCMPEIAAMGAIERLDMMLNDSMYGVLFRDINMYRTFVDQKFSRMINAFAEITINSGEDNYLTTSDAYEKAYTVTASQFINEQFAYDSGLPAKLMGLGHAFEMDPKIENGFLYEMAQAQMARELFPEAPLKYMPPTKYMTGDIFKGYIMNAMFNFIAKSTNQGILLLGMLTEAIHTPFMQDRFLAVENARYILNNTKDFANDIEFKKGGIMQTRAQNVLDETIEFMENINEKGLFDSIEQKMFAEVSRPKHGGKGFDGVHEKAAEYFNPVYDYLELELGLKN
ncbi:lysine 5,6-aminomutase subunit alpha [Carboxylicivirga sp. M1479]|uniref:lysine 5,6-aminomutase subunit alpha n=1 Tax=Carboxylicivirga sp. M1479 TaxID=2594476 RepID=UPI0011781FA7|nr:lysine 5,6-aminomutase subunit alpha [Carboxylicivirga sp. M1479]TRX71850.1 D-lysine 5,6-aminomutase subunit alpha [Carboxylicivirga sp. M1479]